MNIELEPFILLTDLSKAKVGDRLWSVSKGWGTLIDIDHSGIMYTIHYPISVKFDACGSVEVFTMQGKKNYKFDRYSELYWDKLYFDFPAPFIKIDIDPTRNTR